MKLSSKSYILAGFLLLAANVQATQLVKIESITPINDAYTQAQLDHFIIPTSSCDTISNCCSLTCKTATFNVKLDKAYNLDHFYLWNDTDTSYLDSIKMNFKDSSGAVVDSITLSPIRAGHKVHGAYESNTYDLDKVVKNVKSVDFTLNKGNGGVKVCALGFSGTKATTTPEPSGVALLGLGALTLLFRRKR